MNYLEINQKLWNAKTAIHIDSDFYDVPSFLAGKSTLNPIELELLGEVKFKSILHLQCHFGLDSLSLSRLGACVTGVDFSDEAIKKAKELASQTSTDATFIQSDVYSLDQFLDQKFDIVFTSYGVLGWLPDMTKWAEIINHFLKPGGQFTIVEFHPVVWMFNDDFSQIKYSYFNSGAIEEEIEGTYADRNAPIKHDSVSWNHSIGEIMSSLLKTGLRITHFEEYDYSPYNCFSNTVELEKGKFRIKNLESKIPMLFSLQAEKK